MIRTPQSTIGESTDVPAMAKLNKSTMYVSGEQYARVRPNPCICESGTNIPEIKMRGNLIRLEKIITLGGLFDAGDARRTPNVAHESVPSINPRINKVGLDIGT